MRDDDGPQTSISKPLVRGGLFTAWAASSGLLLILVVLIAHWSLRQIEDRARSRARDDAIHRIESIRNRLLEEVAERPGATLEEMVKSARWVSVVVNRQVSTGMNIDWVAIVSPSGSVLVRSSGNDSSGETSSGPPDASAPSGELRSSVESTIPETAILLYSVPVMFEGRDLGAVQIGLSSTGLDVAVSELLRPVWRAFFVLGCVCFLVLLLGGLVMWRLLTREQMLDRAAAKQQHLAAMGALARRMVHEIRNPLNAMRMQIAVIQERLSAPAPSAAGVKSEHLERLDKEVMRLEKLAKTFLAFGRPPRDEPERVNPAELIQDVAIFIRPEFEKIGARVEVEIDGDAEQLCIWMDKSKLREVLLNLAENSREAMDGGRLTIRVAPRSSQEVSIQVTDTGRGIAERDLPMVFEGLRSTKTDGSGLGLLIVKRIVEDVGGCVHVASRVDRGTCFEIVLPLVPEKTEPRSPVTGKRHRESYS